MQFITTNSTGTGSQLVLTASEDAYVTAGVVLGSTNGYAILGSGEGHQVFVDGHVVGYLDAIDLGSALADLGTALTVGAQASVIGVQLHGTLLVGSDIHLTNFGTISGPTAAELVSGSTGKDFLSNHGSIAGTTYGVYWVSSGVDLILHNTGLISGGQYSFNSSSSGDATIRNHGQMIGDILLGSGDDTYDGRFGTVDGTVFGSSGADRFLPGAEAETFDGGDGIDTLDFSTLGNIVVSLANDIVGSRSALGDTFLNIENVIGTRGNDRILGSASSNDLRGGRGIDTLNGGDGADRVQGDQGRDVLTGGLGNDGFYFTQAADFGDKITDFHTNFGDNDIFVFTDPGLAGFGLATGALATGQFVSRADHLAQDTTVRFVFDTVDKTLWFDQDGSGSVAAVLVADLQQSAVLDAAHILLIL